MWQQIKIVTGKSINFIFDLLFPKFCFGCKKEGFYICHDCKNTLQVNYYAFCPLCKNKISYPQSCPHHKSYAKFCLAPFSYDDILVKDLIHNFKYNFIKSIGPELAGLIIESLKKSNLLNLANKLTGQRANGLIIAPIPLHKKRLAWRGFNQSEILAREISKNLSLELFLGLKRSKNTKPQIETSDHKERQDNIKDAFICENPNKIKKRVIILIDDMITTGSTIEECAKTLKKAGAKEIWALTVAR